MGYNYDDYERQGMEALNAMTKREPFAARIVRLEREKAVLLEALERMEWEFTRIASPNGENLGIITAARTAIAQARGDKS